MPTYGYRCTACGHTFERVQKFTDPAVTECETCGAPVKKLLYPVGIAFKGSGFYVNDSAPKGSKSDGGKSEGGEPASKAESAPDSGAKTEPKTDAPKTETATPAPAPAADSKPAAKSDTAASS